MASRSVLSGWFRAPHAGGAPRVHAGLRGAALAATIVFAGAHPASADPPSTQPTDTVDWLLNSAKPAPATQPGEDADHLPTTPPPSPLTDPQVHQDIRTGTLTLSDGTDIHGRFTHTAEKPFRIWVEADQKYDDIQFDQIKSLDAVVVWEREERDWHFKESGSDIKEYSGKTYPARMTNFKVTLEDGQTITGAMDEPIYQITPQGQTLFTINKRDKGPIGQPLAQLVYIKHAEFDPAPGSAGSAHKRHHHSSEPMTPPNLAGVNVPEDDGNPPDSPSVPGGATAARPAPGAPPTTQPGPIFDTK